MSPRPIEEVRPLEEVCPLAHTATGPTPARPVLVQRPLEEVCPLAPPRRGLSTCTHCGRPRLPEEVCLPAHSRPTPTQIHPALVQRPARPPPPAPPEEVCPLAPPGTPRRGLSTCTHCGRPGLPEEVCLPAHSRPTPTQIHPALVQRPARPPHREEVCLLASRPSSSDPLADRLPHIPKRSVHLHTLTQPSSSGPLAHHIPKRSVHLHTLARPSSSDPLADRLPHTSPKEVCLLAHTLAAPHPTRPVLVQNTPQHASPPQCCWIPAGSRSKAHQ